MARKVRQMRGKGNHIGLVPVPSMAAPDLDTRIGHCQLVEGSALLPRDIEAPDRSQQAHVTASHSTNARVRSRRW